MPKPRLTPEQHEEIRRLYAEPGDRRWTQEALAALYGVSDTTISYIVNPDARARKREKDREHRQDPAVRQRHIEACRKWHQSNREYRNEYERAYKRRKAGV